MKRLAAKNLGLNAVINSPGRKRIIILISGFTLAFSTCCAITLFAAGAFNRASPELSFNVAAPVNIEPFRPAPAPPVRQTQKATRVETEVVTIHPYGFDQAEIIRPAGRFFLIVDDRSGMESVSLRIRAEASSNALREVSFSREQTDWDELFDLQPGRYLLTEADHPDWVCRLTITAK